MIYDIIKLSQPKTLKPKTLTLAVIPRLKLHTRSLGDYGLSLHPILTFNKSASFLNEITFDPTMGAHVSRVNTFLI